MLLLWMYEDLQVCRIFPLVECFEPRVMLLRDAEGLINHVIKIRSWLLASEQTPSTFMTAGCPHWLLNAGQRREPMLRRLNANDGSLYIFHGG